MITQEKICFFTDILVFLGDINVIFGPFYECRVTRM